MTSPVQETSKNFLVAMYDNVTNMFGVQNSGSLNSRSVVKMDLSSPQTNVKAGEANVIILEIFKAAVIVGILVAGVFGALVAGIAGGIASGSFVTATIATGVGLGAVGLAALFFFSTKNL